MYATIDLPGWLAALAVFAPLALGVLALLCAAWHSHHSDPNTMRRARRDAMRRAEHKRAMRRIAGAR